MTRLIRRLPVVWRARARPAINYGTNGLEKKTENTNKKGRKKRSNSTGCLAVAVALARC